MNKQDIIISLLKEIDKNIDNVNDSEGTNANLKELIVTANGEYLPADYNADGFSKVTARFDTSSLPKVQLDSFKLSNNCFDDNGQWIGGEFADFSVITTMSQFSYRLGKPKHFDNVTWNFPEESGSWAYAFEGNSRLTYLDFSNAIPTKVTNLTRAFANYMNKLERINGLDKIDTSICTNFDGFIYTAPVLKSVDITSWDFTNAKSIGATFWSCPLLTSFIGNKTIEDVIQNDVKAFKNVKVGFTIVGDGTTPNIDRASLRATINGLADLTGQTAQTLNIGTTLIAKLTEEDIAIATAKNWTIA